MLLSDDCLGFKDSFGSSSVIPYDVNGRNRGVNLNFYAGGSNEKMHLPGIRNQPFRKLMIELDQILKTLCVMYL